MQRRRGRQLEDALLDAAWAELTEHGYANFTLESVARRAATSTPVIYRRWPNKRHMVEAALSHADATREMPVPDSGTLRGDLVAMMQATNDTRIDLIAALAGHLGSYFEEEGTSPAQLREHILGGRGSAAEEIFQRAIARGEVEATAVTRRIRMLAFDLFRHEVMTTLRPVPQAAIEEIVDDIVLPLVTRPSAAARPTAESSTPPWTPRPSRPASG